MVYALQGHLSADHAKADRHATSEEQKLREACQGFEALFIHKMMQTMRQATMESDLVKKSNAEKIFTDMLDEELSGEAAKASVNGLADMLYDSLKWSILDPNGEKASATADSVLGELSGLRAANRKEIPLNTPLLSIE